MRTLVAVFAIALLPVAAHAQSNPSLTTSRGERLGNPSYRVMKPRFQKEVDDALYKTKDQLYEDALRSIPDAKKEDDPWRNAR